MNFYHFVPVSVLQGFMRGMSIGPIPTLCPTPSLIGHGNLTLYCQYGRPLTFRLSPEWAHQKKTPYKQVPADLGYLKLTFEEKQTRLGQTRQQNQFTLQLLTNKEQKRFLLPPPEGGEKPKGPDKPASGGTHAGGTLVKDTHVKDTHVFDIRVFGIPKGWEKKQNRILTGASLVLAIDDLVSVFRNNLMQVINANQPHNKELYPDAKSKLEAARNIYVYAAVYLKGYQKRLERALQDPHIVNLMNSNTLTELRQEQVLLLSLKTIWKLLGDLVAFYQKGQVPDELEKSIAGVVADLPKGPIKYAYL